MLPRTFAPLRTITARPSLRLRPQRTTTWARFASSKSPSSQFYGTFGRPILKVFLMAVFTYQIAYYFWVKLEQDEIKGEMQSTISELEERIHQLEKVQK